MVNGSTVRLAGSCQGVTRHQHQAPAPDTKELSGGHQEAAGTKSQRVTRHKEAGGRQLGNTKNLSWGSPYAHPAVPAPIMGGHKMLPKIVAILVKGHKNIFRIGLIKGIKLQIEWWMVPNKYSKVDSNIFGELCECKSSLCMLGPVLPHMLIEFLEQN